MITCFFGVSFVTCSLLVRYLVSFGLNLFSFMCRLRTVAAKSGLFLVRDLIQVLLEIRDFFFCVGSGYFDFNTWNIFADIL